MQEKVFAAPPQGKNPLTSPSDFSIIKVYILPAFFGKGGLFMGKLCKLLSRLAAAAVVAVLLLAALHFYGENYVYLCGGIHRRDAQVLDLQGTKLSRLDKADRFPGLQLMDLRGTGLTKEQYDTLARLQPNCRILWDVPFQGQVISQDAEILTITSLTEEEVALLDHLPNLLFIDARDCEEYALLQQLQQRHPDCHIIYSVSLDGRDLDYRETELTLNSVDIAALRKLLPYLPQTQKILLTGTLPSLEDLTQLREAFPQIHFDWETDLGGVILSSGSTRLDLQGTTLDSSLPLEEILPYYPALTYADMRGCGYGSDRMMALADRFPDITFLWDMDIAGVSVSSDAVEIDISGHAVEDISQIEAVLPYFPNLQKVIMCGCGIDSETMDAVNKRYENIRFVWSVYVGSVLLRTDATYYIPVKWGSQVTTENLYNLRYCTDMIGVDIGHMPVSSCEWAAYMPNLRYLLMADTQVSDLTPLKDLKNLIYLELFLTQVTDLSPLVGCTALEDLNLCYTYGDPRPLLEIPTLKNIWWSGGWGLSAYAHQFRENNPDIRLEYSTVSSTGGGWRELQNYYDMRDLMGMGYMTG